MRNRPLRSQALRTFCLIEHSKLAYLADFAAYCLAMAIISRYLIFVQTTLATRDIVLLMLLGYLSWSFTEYCLHRFLLHQYTPFLQWHGEHHQQPNAFICTATPVSMAAIWITIYLPAWLLTNTAMACSFTLGLLMGYVWYASLHHAIHHWESPQIGWLLKKRRLHRLHHRSPGYQFGVTTGCWDRWLRTQHPEVNTHD